MVARWGGILKGLTATTSATASVSGGGGILTPAFLDTDSANAQTLSSPVTFSNLSLGSAAANRLLVAGVITGTNGNTNIVPTAVTIAGVAATLVKGAIAGEAGASIWKAPVPAGTSGTVTVTLGGVQTNTIAIGLWSVKTNTQGERFSGSSITGASIAAQVPTGGYGIVLYTVDTDTAVHTASDGITPSGYTEDFDTVPHNDSGGTIYGTICNGGHITANATIDATATQTPVDQVLIYASWGP